MRFSNKTAVVTGGASGIGRAVVQRVIDEGGRAIIADIDDAAGRNLAGQLGAAASYTHLDVTDEAGWQSLKRDVEALDQAVNVLVHSAGICPFGSIEDTSLNTWQRVMDVNLTAGFLANKYAVAMMRGNGGGAIVNVASALGIKASPGLAAYCASKAGLLQLTKCVALHCAKEELGIRCNAVLPGGVDTPLMAQGEGGRQADRAALERQMSQIHALKRMSQPGEIAAAILFLASDDASFVTASAFVVDGGLVEL